MAAEQTDFSQILNSLLSVDNAVRQSAEVSEFQNLCKCIFFRIERCK